MGLNRQVSAKSAKPPHTVVASRRILNPPKAIPASLSPLIVHVQIAHIYASFEALSATRLRGKAFLVLHPEYPDRVWDCSAEAEKKGVEPGMSLAEAHRKAQSGFRVVTAHPELYAAHSQNIVSLYHTFSRLTELVPPAHAFLDLSEFHYSAPSPVVLGEQLRSALEQAGYIAYIGVAHGKFFAELAAHKAILSGYHDILAIPSGKEQEFLCSFPLSILRYMQCPPLQCVGEEGYSPYNLVDIEAHLHDLGITAFQQLAGLTEDAMYRRFGDIGIWLWHIVQGEDTRRTIAGNTPVSQNARMEFVVPTQGEDVCRAIQQLVYALSNRLVEKSMRGEALTLLLWEESAESYNILPMVQESLTLRQPANEYGVLLQQYLLLFSRLPATTKYSRVQIRISNIFTSKRSINELVVPAILPPTE